MRHERIGNCDLYLGDCRAIVPDLNWSAVVSDPPFGMAFQSNYRAKKHAKIQNDDTDEHLLFTCGLPASHSKYVFSRWDNIPRLPKPNSLITWVKNNWSMGDLDHEHARQTEVALFYRGDSHFFPTGRPSDVVHCSRTGNNYHPTEKPVSLMQAVVGWTAGTVLDCYMGSGTTLVACAKLGRKGIGIELDPDYFEIACRRVEEAYRQPDLLIHYAPKQPKQVGLFDET